MESPPPLKRTIMEINYVGYPVFKGLQKPLEFMGIRGRFLTFAAGAIGLSFVGFIVFSIIMGKLAGFIAMLVIAITGLITIYIKQRSGLHAKKRKKGIFIYSSRKMQERHTIGSLIGQWVCPALPA